MTKPVLQNVSQATRDVGSCARQASSTESLTASHSLSGWPSVTDSDVKRYRLMTGADTTMDLAHAHPAFERVPGFFAFSRFRVSMAQALPARGALSRGAR